LVGHRLEPYYHLDPRSSPQADLEKHHISNLCCLSTTYQAGLSLSRNGGYQFLSGMFVTPQKWDKGTTKNGITLTKGIMTGF